jgi:hypothetical protein
MIANRAEQVFGTSNRFDHKGCKAKIIPNLACLRFYSGHASCAEYSQRAWRIEHGVDFFRATRDQGPETGPPSFVTRLPLSLRPLPPVLRAMPSTSLGPQRLRGEFSSGPI